MRKFIAFSVLVLLFFVVVQLTANTASAQGPTPPKNRVEFTTLSDYFDRVLRKLTSVNSLTREWPTMSYTESYRMQGLPEVNGYITIRNAFFTNVMLKPATSTPGLCFWLASLYDAKGLIDERVAINCGDTGVLQMYESGMLNR